MANALARATSPYLRQHQANPVQWLPWGEDAFRRAQQEHKPVLLSVGYAACHWCHVMARESFDNADTAALMNEHFISIKVDREERPDVDAVYLRALQAMGKRGGWPLTMFLTPTGKPFWGGTYFPPDSRGGQPAFREVLVRVSAIYHADPATAEAKAAEVLDALLRNSRTGDPRVELESGQIMAVAGELLRNMDPQHGGLRGTPKFPYPALLRFLWNAGRRAHRQDMQDAVMLTLRKMIDGGIFDHLGGGFARYATDAGWQVPHFEKMLYDNALLVHLLTDVWRAQPVDALHDAVQATVDWLLREMALPAGAFACSLDAQSAGAEGLFYLWDEPEIDQLLGPHAALFKRVYGVTREGNHESRNVLNRLAAPPALTSTEEAELAHCRSVLLRARGARTPPLRDEKILADWNGLTIAALAKAAVVFAQPAWLDAARAAFAFVTSRMRSDGKLCHSWCDGELSAASILDDYADMAWSAVALYEATGRADYLEWCRAWCDRCIAEFRDPASGGFYFTADTAQMQVARICDGQDTATPSGNGVMAQVFARLYFLTGEDRYRAQAHSIVRAFAGNTGRDSYQLATLFDASEFLAGAVQIVIVGDPADPVRQALLRTAHSRAGVDHVILPVDSGTVFAPGHPAAGKLACDGRPTAYVCAGTTCSAPVMDTPGLEQLLRTLDPAG